MFAKPASPALQGGHPQAVGLVGAWLFATGGGTKAADRGPNSMHGTLINAPAWTPGTFGQTLVFNGTSQYVNLFSVVTPASLPLALGNLAAINTGYGFAARIKTTASTAVGGGANWSCGNCIMEARTTGTPTPARAWSFGMEGGKLATARCNANGLAGGQRIISSTSINDGVEHHIAVSIDVNAVSLYIDSRLDATGTFTGLGSGNFAAGEFSMASASANICCQIGARTTNAAAAANWWADTLDHLIVWSRAPTGADVRAHFADAFAAFRQPTRVRRSFAPVAAATQRQYAVSMGA